MSVGRHWGTHPEERAGAWPCDAALARCDLELYRGVSVAAPAPIVFRWLCQLRAAPYSYDWIDNFGRRSPRRRDPKLERLEAGQRVMTIFRLESFERDRQLTARTVRGSRAERLFGAVAVTYRLDPEGAAGCRLLAKVVAQGPPGAWGALARRLLPWGDLVMMRRQLLNLRRLAEREAAA